MMTTCEECRNHIYVDTREDISAIVNYTPTPHHCNYLKRPLSVDEATLVPYRTRCEGFEWKEGAVLEERKKPMTDWHRVSTLGDTLRYLEEQMEFCDEQKGEETKIYLRATSDRPSKSAGIDIVLPGDEEAEAAQIITIVREFLEKQHYKARMELAELTEMNND